MATTIYMKRKGHMTDTLQKRVNRNILEGGNRTVRSSHSHRLVWLDMKERSVLQAFEVVITMIGWNYHDHPRSGSRYIRANNLMWLRRRIFRIAAGFGRTKRTVGYTGMGSRFISHTRLRDAN